MTMATSSEPIQHAPAGDAEGHMHPLAGEGIGYALRPAEASNLGLP